MEKDIQLKVITDSDVRTCIDKSWEAGRQSMLDDICKCLENNIPVIIKQLKENLNNTFIVEQSDYSKDKEIIEGIIEYLECWNDFDSGDEPFEEYCARFERYIKFMKELLNRLYSNGK